MSALVLWNIGWLFTLGFSTEERLTFGWFVASFVFWPFFLGCEIQERLDK